MYMRPEKIFTRVFMHVALLPNGFGIFSAAAGIPELDGGLGNLGLEVVRV